MIDRERLRLGRLRFPLGVRFSPVISTSESEEEEGSCERMRVRSLRCCHSGTLVLFSRFARLFLFRLRGDEPLSLSLESSCLVGLGFVASKAHIEAHIFMKRRCLRTFRYLVELLPCLGCTVPVLHKMFIFVLDRGRALRTSLRARRWFRCQ